MYLEELIKSLKTIKMGNEEAYSLIELKEKIEHCNCKSLELVDSMSLTPYYYDEKIYELYAYALNLDVVDNFTNNYYESKCSKNNRYYQEISFRNKICNHEVLNKHQHIDVQVIYQYIEYILSLPELKTVAEISFGSYKIEHVFFTVY